MDNLKPVKIRDASTLEELLKYIFLSSSNKILNCYKELKYGYDKESLHQYRVSIRRFKSFINFFKNEINSNERIVINNIIKMLLDPTSKARDFDVITEEYISPSSNSHPGDNEFSSLENQSKKIQTELHSNTLNQLSSSNYL
ncbi:MAG: CHAD domain-containing protein, partial [Gammaproteobacteria bacterium]